MSLLSHCLRHYFSILSNFDQYLYRSLYVVYHRNLSFYSIPFQVGQNLELSLSSNQVDRLLQLLCAFTQVFESRFFQEDRSYLVLVVHIVCISSSIVVCHSHSFYSSSLVPYPCHQCVFFLLPSAHDHFSHFSFGF